MTMLRLWELSCPQIYADEPDGLMALSAKTLFKDRQAAFEAAEDTIDHAILNEARRIEAGQASDSNFRRFTPRVVRLSASSLEITCAEFDAFIKPEYHKAGWQFVALINGEVILGIESPLE